MNNQFFISERRFHIQDYLISHSQLLLRSNQDSKNSFNLDVIFFGVDFIQIPTNLDGIVIVKNRHGEEKESAKVYEIQTQGCQYFIKAGFVRVFENDLGLNETSLGVLQYKGRDKEIANSF